MRRASTGSRKALRIHLIATRHLSCERDKEEGGREETRRGGECQSQGYPPAFFCGEMRGTCEREGGRVCGVGEGVSTHLVVIGLGNEGVGPLPHVANVGVATVLCGPGTKKGSGLSLVLLLLTPLPLFTLLLLLTLLALRLTLLLALSFTLLLRLVLMLLVEVFVVLLLLCLVLLLL